MVIGGFEGTGRLSRCEARIGAEESRGATRSQTKSCRVGEEIETKADPRGYRSANRKYGTNRTRIQRLPQRVCPIRMGRRIGGEQRGEPPKNTGPIVNISSRVATGSLILELNEELHLAGCDHERGHERRIAAPPPIG